MTSKPTSPKIIIKTEEQVVSELAKVKPVVRPTLSEPSIEGDKLVPGSK